jgi:hypothetical protein
MRLVGFVEPEPAPPILEFALLHLQVSVGERPAREVLVNELVRSGDIDLARAAPPFLPGAWATYRLVARGNARNANCVADSLSGSLLPLGPVGI